MARLDPPLVYNDSFGNILNLTETGQLGPYKGCRWSGWVECTEGLNNEHVVKSLIQPRVGEGYVFPREIARPFHVPYYTKLQQRPNTTIWDFVVERDYLD